MSLPDYLRRSAELALAQPQWKWFGAWLVATLEAFSGPLDRGLLQVLFGLFLLDTLLGLTHALLRREFHCRRLSYALVKGAVYFTLLSAAWFFRRSDALGVLPIGMILATGLEGFLIFTEGLSVLQNADKILVMLGVDTSRLRRLARLFSQSSSGPGPRPPRLRVRRRSRGGGGQQA